MRLVALALIGFVLPALADDKKEPDLKPFVGGWTIEKAELGGMDITEHLKAMKFDIREGGKYTAVLGEEKDEGSFTIDPSKSPKEMDITSTGGPNKDKLIKAIYKLDGDTMTVCYELGGGDRPKQFESKKDTKGLLVTYKRKK
jgi:uncharacterized protein (TIGR03067 family)